MSTDRTLGAIVTERPSTARILERYGLDYCCGGGRTLAEACADAGLDPTALVAALAEAAPEATPEWAGLGPVQLIEHLQTTHHVFLRAELPRLSALAAKVRDVHGGRHPELVDVADTFEQLRADLEPHLFKEEQALFPRIRWLADSDQAGSEPGASTPAGIVSAPVRVMRQEHDVAGALLARLRTLTDGYTPPEDGCPSYRLLYQGLAELEADTHLHVHIENNVLFPAAIELEDRLTAPR